MTLSLLCNRQITLERAAQTPGPNGEVLRQWQTLATNIPATLLTFRDRTDDTLNRRGIAITHVIMTPQNSGVLLGDRLFDGNACYLVRFVSNLGDRNRGWAIYCQLIEPQNPVS